MNEIDKIAAEITEDISVSNGLKKPANWIEEHTPLPRRITEERWRRKYYDDSPIFEQGPGRGIPPPTEIIELPADGSIRLVQPRRRPVAVTQPRPAPIAPVVESAEKMESVVGKLGARKLFL